MQQNLQIFKNEQFGEVRTIISEDGEPRFCLADVCNALNLKSYHVKYRLGDDIVSNEVVTDSKGRDNHTLFVNEEGLYATIFESRKPEAKAFRHWVFSEVLPSIRKTGQYGVTTRSEWAEEEALAAQRWREDVIAVSGKFGLCKSSADCLMSYGAYMASQGPECDMSMAEFAAQYGMEYNDFCDLLESARIIVRNGSKWKYLVYDDCNPNNLLPITRVYTVTAAGQSDTYTKWTAFGRAFVQYLLIKHRGITPINGCYAYTPLQCHEMTEGKLKRLKR